MIFRNFRIRATGQWLNDMFTRDADAFTISEDRHLEPIAADYGLRPDELEVVEGATDPRSGTLLTLAHAATPQSSREQYDAATADSERVSVIAQMLDLTD